MQDFSEAPTTDAWQTLLSLKLLINKQVVEYIHKRKDGSVITTNYETLFQTDFSKTFTKQKVNLATDLIKLINLINLINGVESFEEVLSSLNDS